MSGKSDIWNHFIKKDLGALGGTCKYCHQEVKTKGNTTNLRNHLLRRHPTIKTVSLKKKSESGGGKCDNAQNGDGNEQVSETCILYDTFFVFQCTEFEKNKNQCSINQNNYVFFF